MIKNIEVVDEAGNVYEPTWPKRAKGLVKNGRARFVDENKICLACPPDKTEDKRMSKTNIFGEMTVNDILTVEESQMCLSCPPDAKTEDEQMGNKNNIFGELTVLDILTRINNIINQTSYISEACDILKFMGDGDSGNCGAPGDIMGKAKAEALGEIVASRETTNQQILKLYEKMYDDMIRLNGLSETNE